MNPILAADAASNNAGEKFRSSAFRSVKNALRFGRLSRSSSIDDDEKSLMGAAWNGKSSGFDDSTDANSSDLEGGFMDRDDEDDDLFNGGGEDDINKISADGKSVKKKPPR